MWHNRNIVNALRQLKIPVKYCDAHVLSTCVGWCLGVNGTESTCKHPDTRDLLAKVKASVAYFTHHPLSLLPHRTPIFAPFTRKESP